MDKQIVIYDINSMPKKMNLEEILEIYYSTGVLIYDSNKDSNDPYILEVNNLDKDIAIIQKYNESKY